MKKSTRYTAVTTLIFLAGITAAIIITQTSLFKQWLKNTAVSLVQPYVNGDIFVGELAGNLFSHLELQDISIAREEKTLLRIEKISLRYHLLPLLSKQIIIEELILQKPEIHLVQLPDHSWNLASLFRSPDSGESSPQDSTNQFIPDLGWRLLLPVLQLDSALVTLLQSDSSGKQQSLTIKDIQFHAAIRYIENHIGLQVKHIQFETVPRGLELESAQSDMSLTETELDAEDVVLETASSSVSAEVEIDNFRDPHLKGTLEINPLALSDIRRFLENLPLYGSVNFSVEVAGPLDNLEVTVGIFFGKGSITLQGNANIRQEPFTYRGSVNISHFNLARLTQNGTLVSNLNGLLWFKGRGLRREQLHGNFQLRMNASSIAGKRLPLLTLSGEVVNDSLHLSGALLSNNTPSTFNGYLAGYGSRPRYHLQARLQHLDLSDYLAGNHLSSDLNGILRIDGSGSDPQRLAATVNLQFFPSRIREVELHSASLRLMLNEGTVHVERINVSSPLAELTARGRVGVKRAGHIDFTARLEDFSRLSTLLPIDSLQGEGTLNGRISGTADSLVIGTDMVFSHPSIKGIKMEEFRGSLSGIFRQSASTLRLSGEVFQIAAAGLEQVNGDFRLAYEDSIIDFMIEAERQDTFSVKTSGDLLLKPAGFTLHLQTLELQTFGQTWKISETQTKMDHLNSEWQISGLLLTSGNQKIALNGRLDTTGAASRIDLAVDSLRISDLWQVFDPQSSYAGLLNIDAVLMNTLSDPRIEGSFRLSDGQVGGESLPEIAGNIAYHKREFIWHINLVKSGKDSIVTLWGTLPWWFSLNPFKNQLLEEQALQIQLAVDSLDISMFRGFLTTPQNLRGTLAADIRLHHTWRDLRGTGSIELLEAQFDIPEWGSEYRDIDIALQLDEQRLKVERFNMNSGEGKLALIDGSLSLAREGIDNLQVTLAADHFELMDSRKMEAVVDGELTLAGSIGEMEFGGNLSVPRASIYYPAWIGSEETAVELTDRPFFVISPDTVAFDSSGAIRFQKNPLEKETAFTETAFYQKLHGNLSVTLDRNVWLRSNEANIEVEGTLELQKQERDFVLFGTLSTVRGFYKFQGNRFEIEEGKITFNGNPQFNPDLHIVAVHEFLDRSEDEPQERRIRIIISGSKESPQLRFTLDGQEVEQKEVISILLFGKPFDNLAFGQKNEIEEEKSNLQEKATGFLTGQLAKQLSDMIGSELNLDVLQIESGEDLSDSYVRVGKYISPQIFISVSQDFGSQGEEEVQLEYRIPGEIFFLNLFIQASREQDGDTGVDVIWKHEW